MYYTLIQVLIVHLFTLDFNMNTPKTYIRFFLPLLFLLVLVSPTLNTWLSIWDFQRSDENRAFHDSLSIDFGKLDAFPAHFDAYYNDNFSFREPLLQWYHYLKFYYFQISPHPNKTLIGANGWFFMAEKEKEIYQGKRNFTDADLEDLAAEWQYRKHYLDSLGIQFYWLIAPMKHNIYSEYLPFTVQNGGERRVLSLKTYLDSIMPGRVIDPVPMLLQAKQSRKLFYKLDNHWNHEAAEIIARLLVDSIKKDFCHSNIPPIPEVKWKDSTYQAGIHYRVLGVKELIENERYPCFQSFAKRTENYGFPTIEGFAYPWEYEYRYVNPDVNDGLRVLVIRDSFFGHVIPFFAESFMESVYIFDAWQYKLNTSIIETVKPDVVVFETLEVHIEAILERYRKQRY